MSRRGKNERKITFPWDTRRSRLAWFSRRHARAVALASFAVVCGMGLAQVEARRRAVFATRATISTVIRATEAYRADHDGNCPVGGVNDLVNPGGGMEPYLGHVPHDGWGNGFRMVCPGRKNPHGADVTSAGPSGAFEDIDQVE